MTIDANLVVGVEYGFAAGLVVGCLALLVILWALQTPTPTHETKEVPYDMEMP